VSSIILPRTTYANVLNEKSTVANVLIRRCFELWRNVGDVKSRTPGYAEVTGRLGGDGGRPEEFAVR
jgi:hypothetical protein